MDDNKPITIHRNTARADKIINWIQTHLKITMGKKRGQPFILPPFQEQFIRDVYEPEDIDNPGVRLITNGTFSVGRKNGKSELAGALVLVHLIGPESEPEGEIISGATTAKQAKVVFRAVTRFIKAAPNLAKYLKIVPTTSSVYVTVDGLRCSGSRYEAIAAGPDAAQGLNPSLIILDELGFARNRNFFDAMAESQGAREQPFMMNISTQNKDDNHVLSTTIDSGLRRRDGAKCGGKDECSVHKNKSCATCNRDQRAVVHLYAADPECELLDEAQWYQSNPALGLFIDYKRFKARAIKAFENPTEEASFRLYRLNQRVSSVTPVIAAADWKACQMASVTKPAILRLQSDFQFEKGEKIFGGLDMAGRTDLAALSVVSGEDTARVKTWFWKPSEAIVRHGERDGQRYDIYRDNGWLIASEGRWIRPADVLKKITELWTDQDLLGLAYDRDPKHMTELLVMMADHGITAEVASDKFTTALRIVPWGQTNTGMNVAVNALEAAVIQRRLQHDGNPLLSWCLSNAIVDEKNEMRKLVKLNVTNRIDGAVALAMAMGIRELERPKAKAFVPFKAGFQIPVI